MKKKMVAMMMAVLVVGTMVACGSKQEEATKSTANATTETTTETITETTEVGSKAASATATDGKSYTIGISQFAEHGSLDNCREGFLAGLAQEGIVEGENLTVLFDNSQSDMGTASTIADSYVSQKVDLICAIATPSAMTAYNSCRETNIPVIYTAVSDPVGAGLAEEGGKSVGEITGTADTLPVQQQLEMIRELMPQASKIGILYTTSESNSESTIAQYKKIAPDFGFEIVESGINTIADVSLAAADLAGKVDCITNLTDNTVVSALQTVLDAANNKGIPVFGSEIEQVKNGCVASMGLEYVDLGKQTGIMAAKVLKGEKKAAEIPFEVITEASLYVNTTAAQKINLEISEEFLSKATEKFE